MELLFILFPFVFFAFLVWAFIYVISQVRKGLQGHGLTFEKIQHWVLLGVISILIPLFFGFFQRTLFPQPDLYGLDFGLGLILGLGTILLGALAMRHGGVGNAFMIGGLLYAIYITSVYFGNFEVWGKLIVSVLALLGVVGFSYWLTAKDQLRQLDQPRVGGNLLGGIAWLLTYIFSSMTMVYANELINGSSDIYRYTTTTSDFLTVFIIAAVFLVIGLTIKAVKPVSLGFLTSGGLTILYATGISLELTSKTTATVATGLVLAGLIYLAYKRSNKEPEATPPPPPQTPQK